MKTHTLRMCDLPRIWDYASDDRFFTVGKGKRQYHIWACGACGLHYCYASTPDGLAYKRAVEPTQTVTLHASEIILK